MTRRTAPSLLAVCTAVGCAPAPVIDPLPDAVVMVSDSGNQRFVYTQLRDRAVTQTVNLRSLHPDDCGPEYGGSAPADAECLSFQAFPEAISDSDGAHDELVLTYDRQAIDGNFERSAIERIRVDGAPDSPLWRLDALDFVTHYADQLDICSAPQPCGDGSEMPDAPLAAVLRCRLAHVHDFDVLAEDASSVDLLIADTVNERVLTVHLDKTTRCGVVTDVLSSAVVPEWAAGRTPNDVDAVPLDDGSSGVLVTFRSSSGDVAAGGVSGGDDGNGLVMLFRPGAAAWEHAWTYPATGFLNSPHDALVFESAAGEPFLVYAHSDGNGVTLQADWKQAQESRGSIGVALLGDGAPDYRFDAILPETEPDGGFGFLRSALPYGQDSGGEDWLVADSGCMAVELGCPRTPAVRVVRFALDDATDGAGTGAFEVGHGQQVNVYAESQGTPLNCGYGAPYVAQYVATGPVTGAGDPNVVCE